MGWAVLSAASFGLNPKRRVLREGGAQDLQPGVGSPVPAPPLCGFASFVAKVTPNEVGFDAFRDGGSVYARSRSGCCHEEGLRESHQLFFQSTHN
jgi:hypothetical protein